jgi:hypothetical protein
MNENPDIASLWKGRIFMHIEVFDSQAPESGTFPLSQSDISRYSFTDRTPLKEFEIQAEVGSGICLPDNKSYKVRIAIADLFLDTDKVIIQKKTSCVWNKRFDPVIM